MEEQIDEEKLTSELQKRRGRPKKFTMMSKNHNTISDNNNNNNGVIIYEEKKIRALDEIEDNSTFTHPQAEESTSRGGGREVVGVGEVTSKPRTNNHKANTSTRRRRKSNPTRSPLC